MKSLRVMGLCVLATFAFSATVASTAQAGEAGICKKAERIDRRYSGRYLEKNCEEGASEAQIEEGKKNKYEWTSAAGSKYKSSTKTTVLSSTAGEITCKASTDAGEWTGWQTDLDVITFEGCKLAIGLSRCASEGQPAGTIETDLLDAYLINHGTKGPSGLEPKEGEAWVEYQSAEGLGGYVASFVCEPGVLFRIGGSLSGVITPVNARVNLMGKSFTTTFAEGRGEQDLVGEFSENGGETWDSTGPSVETAVSVAKGPKMEIKGCNEAGAVSEGEGAPPCEHEEALPW
jgi:hypothetical protein